MKNAVQIKKVIQQIGETILTLDSLTEEYLINDVDPFLIPADYYSTLFNRFNYALNLQILENANSELLQKYLEITNDEIKRFNENFNENLERYKHRKGHCVAREEDEYNDFFNQIINVLFTQNNTLGRIKLRLIDEIEFVDFGLKGDYQGVDSSLITNDIPQLNAGRATFKLSKKEALMFLYVLEQEKLLEFTDDSQRRLFIESNFNFTEMRNNTDKGKALPMKGVSSEISIFRNSQDKISNNKVLEALEKKLRETILLFEFK